LAGEAANNPPHLTPAMAKPKEPSSYRGGKL
jgi:hypothetical protein